MRTIQSALTKPDRAARHGVSHRTARGGKSHVSDAMLKAALRAYAGNLSQAAKACRLSRQSVWERVRRSPELQAFIAEIEQEVGDLAQSNVVEAIKAGDAIMTRWYLERRNPEYSNKRENREIPPPPDPEEERRRDQLVQFFRAEVERRARLGLPSIFSDAETSPAQQHAPQAPMIDVTPRKANGDRGLQR